MGVSNAAASGMVGSTVTSQAGPNLNYSQGGGKTSIQKAMNSVVQVNPQGIAKLFQEGAQAQQDYYKQGLDYYAASVAQAGQQLQNSYGQANATLTPISVAGQTALNEQMRMMGLQPVSMTQAYANRLNAVTPVNGESYKDLQSEMINAEKITDPAARLAAKNDIISKLEASITPYNVDDEIAKLAPIPDYVGAAKAQQAADRKRNIDLYGGGEYIKSIGNDAVAAAQAKQAAAEKERAAQIEQLKLKTVSQQDKNNQLQSLKNDFQQYYSVDPQTPYTGKQVEEKIAATPGYQFQLESGLQAINRQGAAGGRLNSGNTLTALTEYGQQLAQNSYNDYMANLSNIAGLGSQATNAIANNQVGYGQSMAQLDTGLGNAYATTYSNIGDAINTAKTAEANMRAQLAQFNASMQYNSKQANLNRQQAANTAALQSMPGIMNAGLNQAKFGYSVYNNQQQANSFAANSGAAQRPSGYWSV